jgi:Fe-S cluster biogenesis protein NfuA
MDLNSKLEEIKEILAETGGDIELMDFDENAGMVKIMLKGACSYSPFSRITATEIIEKKLMEVPNINKVCFHNSPY